MAKHRVCPWWLGYLLASRIRRWLQDPAKVVSPYVRQGMVVLEPGPGMGFFTLDIARLVGPSGRVVAVDIQPKMLEVLRRRAAKAGLSDRVDARVAQADSMNLDDLTGRVDFALAFAVVHEMPDAASFFAEVHQALKPGGSLLLAEPAGHLKVGEFEAELALAAQAGFTDAGHPSIRRSRTALLNKGLA